MRSVGLKNLGNQLLLTADQATITGTTAVAIAGLTMAVPAAGTYRFKALLLVTTGLATTGIRPSVTGPAGTLAYRTEVPATSTTSTISYNAANTSAAVPATTGNLVDVEGILVATAAGNVTILLASSTSTGTVIAKAGSTSQLIRLS